jgi:hypothetical protein
MFAHITQDWRGRPLASHEVMVNLTGNTTTEKGLPINAELDRNRYPTGIKVSDDALARVNIEQAKFHREWNYQISPRPASSAHYGTDNDQALVSPYSKPSLKMGFASLPHQVPQRSSDEVGPTSRAAYS